MNKKYAVCIGNNYPGTSAELNGCVNDANDWAEMLGREGYGVHLIHEADKDTAIAALLSVVREARFGDRIIFTYSGHGTWIPDLDNDEDDRRDEALVMTDYMEGGLITDDELHSIMSQSRYGVGKLILSDSCHSGTLARMMGDPVQKKPRFLFPSEFLPISEVRVAEIENQVAATKPRPSASLISGCSDIEYSYDAWFSGRANGAFSYHAIRTYEPGITLNAWHDVIRTRLPNSSYPQTPQVTAQSAYRFYTKAV